MARQIPSSHQLYSIHARIGTDTPTAGTQPASDQFKPSNTMLLLYARATATFTASQQSRFNITAITITTNTNTRYICELNHSQYIKVNLPGVKPVTI